MVALGVGVGMGACVVALGGACMVAPGGVWLLPGGVCGCFWGGMHRI